MRGRDLFGWNVTGEFHAAVIVGIGSSLREHARFGFRRVEIGHTQLGGWACPPHMLVRVVPSLHEGTVTFHTPGAYPPETVLPVSVDVFPAAG
jgi:hypothetical protein